MPALGSADFSTLGIVPRLGPGMLAELAWAFLRGRRRSLAADATWIVARLGRPVRVEDARLIPPSAPFVVVANHYQAPGLWIGWSAAAITAAIAEAREPERRELHWMVISEWRLFELGGRWVPNPISTLLFPRACRVWGLIPSPPRPSDVAGRARALRRLLTYLGRRPGAASGGSEPVGLFPEGRATVALEEAKAGTGAFLHRVSGLGVPLLPVGAYEEGNALVLRFGVPFQMGDPPPAEQGNLDGWARTRVMASIGRLLPPRLWGVYAGAIVSS